MSGWDVIVSGHPLRPLVQGLVAHKQCQAVQVELLTESAVTDYVTQRLGAGAPTALGREIHQRTDGNALFMRRWRATPARAVAAGRRPERNLQTLS